MIKALIVHPDRTVEHTSLVGDLASLRDAIGGGWLEGVGASLGADWFGYCDEEGKPKGLPINALATDIAHQLGWPVDDALRGAVVFVGQGADGDEADVPQRVVLLADTLSRPRMSDQ